MSIGNRAKGHFAGLQRTIVLIGAALFVSVASTAAPSLSSKDVEIICKSLVFLDPPVSGGTVGVAFAKGNSDSEADALAIVGEFGSGISTTRGTLTAKAVDESSLGDGGSYIAFIAASGVPTDKVMALAKSRKLLCITGDAEMVAHGRCVMSVHSQPSVEVIVNLAQENAIGIKFASAFHMMIKEK